MTNKNIFYVYVHRRASDNKPFYVGKGSKDRYKSEVGRNAYWNHTKEKHGLLVEKVFENLSEEEAFQLEVDTIKEFRYFGYPLTNITDGGEGVSGLKQTQETIQKRVLKNTGKKRTAESRQKISNALKGKKLSPETKEKISLHQKGRKKSIESIQKRADSNRGQKRSPDSLANMKKSAKERAIRHNLSEAMAGAKNPSASKEIYTFLHVASGTIFIGTRIELCEAYNLKRANIANLFSQKRKIAVGWTLLKEEK